jgi:hypothetical protein
MEHVLARNIMRHREDNGILYQLQHSFRRNRSCETQLIEFIDDLTKNLQAWRCSASSSDAIVR